MNSLTIFFLSILFGFISFALIARWYVMPALARLPIEGALTPLLFLHSFRYIGMAFIVPGVAAPDLSSAFAVPAAYGDLLAVLLALLALAALRLRWQFAIPLVWLFNLEGTLDLLNAPLQGIVNQINPGQLGATYFIPTVVVPALLVTHFIIFQLLLRSK